jgi:hypothetical protein
MKIERKMIAQDKNDIPAVIITPDYPVGAAVIIHGYGGCKEEQLGLAFRIAETGMTAIAIDLRGHGENLKPFDDSIISDVKAVIEFGKNFGKVLAVGHSLGGRLLLLSDADFVIAISPALNQEFSESTQNILKNMRGYHIKQNSPVILFEILKKMPMYRAGSRNHLILFGSRDVPEIVKACQELKLRGANVSEIYNVLHNDIFVREETFNRIFDQIKEWFKQ